MLWRSRTVAILCHNCFTTLQGPSGSATASRVTHELPDLVRKIFITRPILFGKFILLPEDPSCSENSHKYQILFGKFLLPEDLVRQIIARSCSANLFCYQKTYLSGKFLQIIARARTCIEMARATTDNNTITQKIITRHDPSWKTIDSNKYESRKQFIIEYKIIIFNCDRLANGNSSQKHHSW